MADQADVPTSVVISATSSPALTDSCRLEAALEASAIFAKTYSGRSSRDGVLWRLITGGRMPEASGDDESCLRKTGERTGDEGKERVEARGGLWRKSSKLLLKMVKDDLRCCSGRKSRCNCSCLCTLYV